MCFLMGWALKLSAVGVIYLGMTSGFKVKLPDQPAAQVITNYGEGWPGLAVFGSPAGPSSFQAPWNCMVNLSGEVSMTRKPSRS